MRSIVGVLLGVVFSACCASGALLEVGDMIGIDAGPADNAESNWMAYDPGVYQTSGVVTEDFNTVNNLAGESITGLSMSIYSTTLKAGTYVFGNTDGVNNWPGLSSQGGDAPAVFTDKVTTDIAGFYNSADGINPITVAFDGLDDSLLYRLHVVIAPLENGQWNDDDRVIAGGVTSTILRESAAVDGIFHTIDNLSSSSGELSFEIESETTENPLFNGAVLEVIPEPLSIGLYAAFIGVLAFARRFMHR